MISEEWEKKKQVAKERLSICKQCPKYVESTTICQECGCIMLVKTMFAFTECPLNKWGAIKESQQTDQN